MGADLVTSTVQLCTPALVPKCPLPPWVALRVTKCSARLMALPFNYLRSYFESSPGQSDFLGYFNRLKRIHKKTSNTILTQTWKS